ncbi:MAG: class I SAM-dependent methyltransferase [Candidatus Dormibacteraeota bacterium]|uniref:Class I SAM-dependent methyltransferase n=1 Tax=Candidatus Amunia macphersoniae TaxID=3127014 RepID=A0A934KL09_9BACT|nr:class I SAM-dependent methyltransferase [Candidatus Dormibacteraeota bacterium]
MRAQLVQRFLLMTPTSRVVDIGSGQGDVAAMLTRAHPQAEVLGVELSAEGVSIASGKVPSARFVQRDLLAEAPVPADLAGFGELAVCSEVLEHVDDPSRLLRNATDYLAPGCRVVITVPGGPMSAFDRHIGHRRHHTAASLRAIIDRAGLETVAVFRAGFPFFNLYRLTVILRGSSLIDDVSAQSQGKAGSTLASLVMRVFRWLFRFNLTSSPWGWQMVGIARVPRAGPAGTV